MTRKRNRSALLATLLCLAGPVAAQTTAPAPAAKATANNPATELAADPQAGISDPLRKQLEVIGRYAAEVGRRNGGLNNAPLTGARAARQLDQMVDPFEVSPQLREGRNRASFSGLPSATVLELKRRVQLRAVLRTAQGTLAQLLINEKDVVTIMDKELIDLGDMGTFQAEIQAGTVSLSNPNNPQGKKVVLR